jgi:hypothetical protein
MSDEPFFIRDISVYLIDSELAAAAIELQKDSMIGKFCYAILWGYEANREIHFHFERATLDRDALMREYRHRQDSRISERPDMKVVEPRLRSLQFPPPVLEDPPPSEAYLAALAAVREGLS